MSSNSVAVLIWVWCLIQLILTFIFINWTYSYWSLCNLAITPISNGNPFIVKIIGILTLFAVIMESIFILFQYEIIGNNSLFLIKFYGVFAYPLRILPLYLLLYREWMIFYDIKFQKAIQDKNWRSDINPNESNFFLRYKSSLGHKYRVLFIILFISIPLSIYAIYLRTMYGAITSRPITMLSMVLPIIVSTLLYLKFPKFDDIFGIRNEIKLASILYFLILIILTIFRPLVPSKPPDLIYLIASFISISMPCSLQISFIYYPLKRYNLPTNILSTLKYSKQRPISQQEDDDNDNDDEHDEKNIIDLQNILENNNGFDLYARHLMNEFAVELLLYFIETQQFINLLQSELTKEHKSMDQRISSIDVGENEYKIDLQFDELVNIKFPKTAPKSAIVDKSNNPNTKKQCIDLYKKYIEEDGMFEINISGKMRNEIKQQIVHIDNLNNYQLLHLWDTSRNEVYHLMGASVERFQETAQFKQYQKFAKNGMRTI